MLVPDNTTHTLTKMKWPLGSLSSSEVYNVTTGEWETKGNMAVERAYFAVVELSDGSVLVAGGRDDSGKNLASCEVGHLYTQVFVVPTLCPILHTNMHAVQLHPMDAVCIRCTQTGIALSVWGVQTYMSPKKLCDQVT